MRQGFGILPRSPAAWVVGLILLAVSAGAAAPGPEQSLEARLAELAEAISREPRYGTVSPTRLHRAQAAGPLFVLDVREAEEIEAHGRIGGSVHIPLRDLLRNLSRLPPADGLMVVYGASSHRGAMAVAALRFLGYRKVYNLAFGYDGWRASGLPVVRSPPRAPPPTGAVPPDDDPVYSRLTEFLSNLPADFHATSARAVRAALGSATPPLLLDLRGPGQYAAGHRIGDAVNLPFEEVFESLERLPHRDAPIVAYCASGHRSAVVAMGLRLLGYRSVMGLDGGTNGWAAAGLPFARGSPGPDSH